MHLEDSMVMYGIYNAEPVEKLIDTVYHIHNITTLNEKSFAGKLNTAYTWPVNKHGIQHYAYKFTIISKNGKRKKYVKMYEEFIMQQCMYAKAIQTLAKGYLPTSLITPLKLQDILDAV